jgi:transglutaminase-like putative cysteine protease
MGGIVMFRTTEEGAKAPGGAAEFDLIQSTVVKVARKIPDAERTRRVKYRLTLEGNDPTEVFPIDARQQFELNPALGVKTGPAGAVAKTEDPKARKTAILDVRSVGPLDGEATAGAVDPQYLRSNPLINSDDSRVRDLAERATRGAVDPWEKAVQINHFVFQKIANKNFENAFAPAGEVARTLSGDCTEHSVLAAAMCRAAGIPARVAIGLIYVDQLGGFGYHMWNEVFVNQRWISLDASFDQSTTDAVHLKLADTSLEGVSPFEAFLPVVKVAGKLEIEAIELR